MSPTPIRSMTGFGEAEADAGDVRLRIEIRTVNQRHLKFQFRTPPGHDRCQRAIERALRAHFARGQVTVTLTVERAARVGGSSGVRFDTGRAREVAAGLRALRNELGLEGEVDLGLLARCRGILEEEDLAATDPDLPEDTLSEVAMVAALRTVAAREEEGGCLKADLEARLDAMEAEIAHVEARAPERMIRERDRLREAVASLMEGQGEVDEERIAREIAHLAERWDVHEELVRFRSHIGMFRAALATGSEEGVGKRLTFVSQELLREANTIGSKGNDALIAESVVVLKEQIEKVREQIENVE